MGQLGAYSFLLFLLGGGGGGGEGLVPLQRFLKPKRARALCLFLGSSWVILIPKPLRIPKP